jgi:imidazolonepropionase
MSHLEEISDEGLQAMSKNGTVAVLLPSTAYILRLTPPPARKMITAGIPVALGSDFNPNAYCLSMPTIMHLACVLFRMSMPEALVAATLNAAFSLGRGKTHGAIAVGRVADMVVLNTKKWEHLIYRFGCHHMVIEQVIKGGQIVFSK